MIIRYLSLASILAEDNINNGEAYNFGPPAYQNYSVRLLISEMSKYWSNVKWIESSNSKENLHEAALLKLNCDKALSDLNWISTLNFEETVRMTVQWYKSIYEGSEELMYDFTMEQIGEYTQLAQKRGIDWATL